MVKTPRLKVYAAQFGFHDSVVAAPNQAKALAAWGTRQNLFAEGRAIITDDAEAVAAAMAHPETPLRRAVGSKDPFSLDPGLPTVPDGPARKRPKLEVVAKAEPPLSGPAAPDRSALSAAEKALAAIKRRRIEEERRLAHRREALEADEAAARQQWGKDLKAAEAKLEAARRAYRAEGGEI